MPLTAWDSPSHPAEYDYLASAPAWLRRRFYEGYPEIKALPAAVTTIMEVGCATGELARYLLQKYPTAFYVGYDLSAASIQRARAKHLEATFIYGHFQDYRRTAQLVICRDVLHHQDDPWQFLTDLYHAAEETLLVTLRTASYTYKDSQSLYGQDVPYWMISHEDLTQWARTHECDMEWLDAPEPRLSFWLRSALWIARRF